MKSKRPFQLKSHIYLLIHAGMGSPYALRFNLRKGAAFVAFAGFLFFSTVTGSLLFFRELELNRNLQEQILEFQNREKLALVMPVPITRNLNAPSAPTESAPETGRAEKPDVKSEISAAPVVADKGPFSTGARIGDLTIECNAGECGAKLSLVPVSTGIAQGQLLFVLETEIPRIGVGNPTTQIRKRYFMYPGRETVDQLDQAALVNFDRKQFRFTRALGTTATFTVGKLLRPLAVNVYLFDKDRVLVHHERKTIDAEE